MPFSWSKVRYSPIAIDFGADSLKLLQLNPVDPPQLVAAAAVELPEEARAAPAARSAFFADSLRQLLKAAPFRGNRAVCSIPAYQTLVQHLQIARVEHEDFAAQIGLQLRQRLNIEPARMVVRHFEVAPVVRDNTPKQEVICMAASRDAVLQHVEIARRARLDVVGMHCEPVAILKAFEHLYRPASEAQRTTCFLDIGAATTKVVIAHGAVMVFAKMIHAAGDHFTRQECKAQGVSFAEARLARRHESAARAAAPPAGPAGSAAATATALAEPPRPTGLPALDAQANADTLDCLIDELQLCVRYHASLFPGRPIEKLVFLGGEARQVAICQKIARALRIGAQLGDPLARMMRLSSASTARGVDLNQPQPGWAVPMGLCLSEAGV